MLIKCAYRIQITHTHTLSHGQCQLGLIKWQRDDPIEGDGSSSFRFYELNTVNRMNIVQRTIILMNMFDISFFQQTFIVLELVSCVNHAI